MGGKMNTRKTRMVALVVAIGLSGTAQASLHDRGGGLIYDDVLNVTWLQDANYAKTSGYDADGMMNWADANAWATNLSYYDSVRNVIYDDWRLPTLEPLNGITFNYSYNTDGASDIGWNITSPKSEMAYMFYVNLGNPGQVSPTGTVIGCYVDPSNTCLDNAGVFTDLNPGVYWYGTKPIPEYVYNQYVGFVFVMQTGNQYEYGQGDEYYAWAVRDGDVAAVPEASTYAMLLSGLGLVGAMARRRKQAEI
jgi:hypothetical protein